MNLRNRCCGDGWAEFDEMIFELAAEGPLDGVAGFGHRERLGLVLQVTQVGGEFRADDIGAGGEELPELHVARPELGQRVPRRDRRVARPAGTVMR